MDRWDVRAMKLDHIANAAIDRLTLGGAVIAALLLVASAALPPLLL